MSNDEMAHDVAVAMVVKALCAMHDNVNIADEWVKAVTRGNVPPSEIARLTKSLLSQLNASVVKAKQEKADERKNLEREIADLRRRAGLGPQGG